MLAFTGLLLVAGVPAALDDDRRVATGAAAGERFVDAWERSRRATFVRRGIYERRSEVSGQRIGSEDVLAQRPPRRLHRQLGGVAGRDDDRTLLCPATADGEPAPCSFGPPSGRTYDEDVAQEVEGVERAVLGPERLYDVVAFAGCFRLDLRRPDPRAPFGVEATFCFDAGTGAPTRSEVHHEAGIVERITVTQLSGEVRDRDLEP